MYISALKLYRIYKRIIVPQRLPNGKRVCLAIFGENTDFFEVFSRLNIRTSFVRYMFVPLITRPFVYRLTSDLRTKIRSYGLVPVSSFWGDYSKIPGVNFYIDYTAPIDSVIARFRIKNYMSAIAYRKINELLDTLSGVPSDIYDKVLIYAVNLDNPISPIIMRRKFYPIFLKLMKWFSSKGGEILPFDKILLFVFSKTMSNGKFILIFDKSAPNNNFSYIRSLLIRLREIEKKEDLTDEDLEQVADEVVQQTFDIDKMDEEDLSKVRYLIFNYLRNSKDDALEYVKVMNSVVDEIPDVASGEMEKGVSSEPSFDRSKEKSEEEKNIETVRVLPGVIKRENVTNNFTLRISPSPSRSSSIVAIGSSKKVPKNVVTSFTLKTMSRSTKELSPEKIHKNAVEETKNLLLNKVGEILLRTGYSMDKGKVKREEVYEKKDVEKLVESLSNMKEEIIPKEKSENVSRNVVIANSGIEKVLAYSNPSHILRSRTDNYRYMLTLIITAFKTLEKRKYPLYIKDVKLRPASDPDSVLEGSKLVEIIVRLENHNRKKTFTCKVVIPFMDENGFFTLYGNKRLIIFQNVILPVFFLKKFQGKISTSYSGITVFSNRLSRGNYLFVYIGGMKLPLLPVLAYRIGFEEALNKFGVSYEVSQEEVNGENVHSVGLGKNRYLIFKFKDEAGRQLVEVFKPFILRYISSIKKSDDIIRDLNKETLWQEYLQKYTGNRNSLYIIDQVLENILMPIDVRILSLKGLPTDIIDLIIYVAKEAVKGRVDTRNDIYRQRVRTFEVVSNLLLKQINKAYAKYEADLEMGNKDATFDILSKKVLTDVVTSQNISLLENINPLEEISFKTRVSPVGVSGVPDAEYMPIDALDVHPSYFGNVDPLETPDGANVGVQQHLSLGASITNLYGTFLPKKIQNPLEVLSPVVSCIPFVESNEGARVTMASGQMKQALPLLNPEVPAIQTAMETILTKYLSDSFIRVSPVDGVVSEVTDDFISIKDSKGHQFVVSIEDVELRSGQGKNGLSIFKPIVKVGDRVKKGQILAEGSNVVDGVISNGINVLVAYMPWKGYNFEDGMVVSEELVERFTSVHSEYEDIMIEPDEDVIDVVEIGKELRKGDILLTKAKSRHDVGSYVHLRTDGGLVSNIEIYSNIPVSEMPQKIIPAFRRFVEKYEKIHNVKYPLGEFKFRAGEKPFEGIYVRFTVRQFLKLQKGDKLNNRHFNKGVVAIIEKAENMPVTPWGERVQMVYNPLAIINRMITGQILEMHTGLISRKLAILISEMEKNKFVDILKKVLSLLDGTPNQTVSKNIVNSFIKMSNQEYKKVSEKISKDRFFPLLFPPFMSPKRENVLKALSVLNLKPRYPLYLPEFGVTTEPVSVGYVYVMKLEHISEKKIHARGLGTYMSKTMTPVGGKKRGGGQQFGEYDLYSVLSWGCKYLVDEILGPLSSDHVTKNKMISEIIQKGDVDFMGLRTNPVKELYNAMLRSVLLEEDER